MIDYAVEYLYEYYDIGGTQHKVELLLLEYSGGSTNIEHAAPVPVRMRHTGSKTDFEETIIQGQELIFSFYVARDDVDTWDSLFESDYKDYKLRYYVDSNLEFEGYVKPENLSKSYVKSPPFIQITLSATDALADLKTIDFLDSNEKPITDRLSQLVILKHALTPIGINLDFQIQLGTYESTYMAASDCALEEIQLDTRRFVEDKVGRRVYMSCWQVIETVLKGYNVKFKQYKGQYQITCHHEYDSYAFIYDWATLTEQSRNATDNIIDITDYNFDPIIEQQKVSPLDKVKITFKNKDLGGDITALDLDDWGNDPPWTIDFSNGFAVVGGEVELKSDDDTYDEYILTDDFGVNQLTNNDYLKVTFDHLLSAYTDGVAPFVSIKITVTRPDATTKDAWFNCAEFWQSYESEISEAFKIIGDGDYSVRLSFNATPDGWTTAEFKLKEFRISKIVNSSEDLRLTGVTYDEYYEQTSGKGIGVFETEVLLADCAQVTELGALLYEASAWENTVAWRTYNHAEDIKLLDIYSRYILDNRYDYKNYLRIKIIDRDNTIGFDNILLIEGASSADNKDYVFISYDRDFRAGVITAELIELLTIQESYDNIHITDLDSINGERASSSMNVNIITSESILPHNDLAGLQGGQAAQYYHLTAAEYTNVGNLDTMAYEAAADYYTAAQVDTWRSSVTQQEMDWLHGITSDVQTQITARAVIGATPADDRVCTWSDGTTIQGEPNLKFDGTTLVIDPGAAQVGLKIYGDANYRGTFFQDSNDIFNIYNYDTETNGNVVGDVQIGRLSGDAGIYYDYSEDRTGFGVAIPSCDIQIGDGSGTKTLAILGANTEAYCARLSFFETAYETAGIEFAYDSDTNKLHLFDWTGSSRTATPLITWERTGNIGINDATPSYQFDVNGTGRFTGNLYGDANVENLNFASGFQGDKWQITEDGDGEFENVFIRGGLTAWELIINRLHYQCGGLIIGAGGGKIATIVDATVGAEVVTFEDPEGNLILPFTEDAIVIIQDFDLNRTTIVKKIVRQVDSINSAGTEVTFEATAGWVPGGGNDDTGIVAVNDEVVAIGHISDANLDASIYFSAVDSDNPFMRVFDGVDSYAKWSLGDKTTIKLQLGNLASLANYDILPADPGYGFYSDNVYLTGELHTSGAGTRCEIISHEINLYEAADLFAQIKTDAGRGAGAFYCSDGASEARFFPIGIDDGTNANWIIQWDNSALTVEIINNLDVAGTSLFNDNVNVDGNIRSTETKYWSCPGLHFDSVNEDDNITKSATNGSISANANGIIFVAAIVGIPNGAVISAVKVFGSISDENWTLERVALTNAAHSEMATAAINTEDASISDATVDNNTYGYFLFTTSLDTGDSIYGARITYVL